MFAHIFISLTLFGLSSGVIADSASISGATSTDERTGFTGTTNTNTTNTTNHQIDILTNPLDDRRDDTRDNTLDELQPISPDKSKNLDDSERKAAPGDDTFNTEAPGGQNFETNVPPKTKSDP